MFANLNNRILKVSLVFIFLVTTVHCSFAQVEKFNYNGHSIEIDKKVIDNFGLDQVSAMKVKNPDLLLYHNYYVNNAYTVQDIGAKVTSAKFQRISSLTISTKSKASAFKTSDHASFNILAYPIQLTNQQQVFIIDNSTQAIVVSPKSIFMEKYNAYRNTIIQ